MQDRLKQEVPGGHPDQRGSSPGRRIFHRKKIEMKEYLQDEVEIRPV